jgi:hypothetical protein
MFIYKLKYSNKANAITDLIAKGVVDINEDNTATTQAVVEIGLIVDTPAVIVDNEIVTPATYIDGYHFDIMVNNAIDFGTNRMTPTTSVHSFLGFNTNDYNTINPNTNINETTTS